MVVPFTRHGRRLISPEGQLRNDEWASGHRRIGGWETRRNTGGRQLRGVVLDLSDHGMHYSASKAHMGQCVRGLPLGLNELSRRDVDIERPWRHFTTVGCARRLLEQSHRGASDSGLVKRRSSGVNRVAHSTGRSAGSTRPIAIEFRVTRLSPSGTGTLAVNRECSL
jgi:hypothetical protein